MKIMKVEDFYLLVRDCTYLFAASSPTGINKPYINVQLPRAKYDQLLEDVTTRGMILNQEESKDFEYKILMFRVYDWEVKVEPTDLGFSITEVTPKEIFQNYNQN